MYELRHRFATRAVAAGVDLPTLSAMLGHTSITMTMRYVHPAAEQKKLAAASLESFRINGLIEAASEQAVGTNMGTVAQVSVVQTGQNVLPVTQEVAGFNGYQAALVRRQLTPALISSLSGTADCCGLSFFDNLPSDGLYSRGTHTREHREGVRDWLD